MMPAALSVYQHLSGIAADSLRFKPFIWPSQWIAENCWTSGQTNGTGVDQRFDIWYYPCNVGITDSVVEPKRGSLIEKAVQQAVSHYLQNTALYFVARRGGPIGYSMAKDDTVRDHVLDRIDVNLQHSEELRDLYLPGRANHETILSKRFKNATLKFFGSAAESNFKSNPYCVAFADEFEMMRVFKGGSDPATLLRGRQAAFAFPFFLGWSSPREENQGIDKATKEDSDLRHFFMRCPHCRQPIDFDWDRDVRFEYYPDTNQPIADSAELLCSNSQCKHAITDSERAAMILHAAQAACVWYTAVPYDPDVGWISTLAPEEAAKRQFAGFVGYSHLYNPHKPLRDIALEFASCSNAIELKTFYNDSIGKAYTIRGKQLSPDDIRAHRSGAVRTHVPQGALWITLGSDVQQGGDNGDLMFYFDISAWVPSHMRVRKVTLQIARLKGTLASGFSEIKDFVLNWHGTDDRGQTRRLDCVVIDAGYRTKHIFPICNSVSTGKKQFAIPVIYGSLKAGEGDWKEEPQAEKIGDPSRLFVITTRDWLVGRAMERVMSADDVLELPADFSEEMTSHYLANEQVEHVDRAGNKSGMHWEKKLRSRGFREPDDWLQAAAYSEFAAVLLGLDKLREQVLQQALQAAEKPPVPRRVRRAEVSEAHVLRARRLHVARRLNRGGR